MEFWKIAATAFFLSFSVNLNAALLERLGGLAYYDDVADLTWLTDASAGAASIYDDGGLTIDGRMSWGNAMDWAASLNVAGVTGWRLPTTIDVGNDGYTYPNVNQGVDAGMNITTHSELSNMFYNVLGNLARYDINGNHQPGYGLTNTGPFVNLFGGNYWSETDYIPNANAAWQFNTNTGYQNAAVKGSLLGAWAVHSGDVSAVPIPSTIWLFGSGLIGLVGFARRKKT